MLQHVSRMGSSSHEIMCSTMVLSTSHRGTSAPLPEAPPPLVLHWQEEVSACRAVSLNIFKLSFSFSSVCSHRDTAGIAQWLRPGQQWVPCGACWSCLFPTMEPASGLFLHGLSLLYGWTRWSQKVPSNLNYSEILWNTEMPSLAQKVHMPQILGGLGLFPGNTCVYLSCSHTLL